ncbi:MAG: GreA/GreB family elongation factor [Verrucomicrobia bacterium]|nr:GreA/GreB family elongation factor [Verrucomicrobiota bacterium]
MSKAFTREDDETEEPVVPALVSPLPPGAKNYMTAEGAKRLRTELANMLDEKRPALAPAAATDPEAKRELAQLDQRIRYLQQSLSTAEIVPPTGTVPNQVAFGSTVTVRDTKGVTSVYRIVGVDEADFERNEVSWLSPIAKALMNARLGQKVPFKFPRGATELEVVKIE